MTTKKRGPPPRPPTSLPKTIIGISLSTAAKRLMGLTPQPFPVSNTPRFRNNRLRLTYPNPINVKRLNRLNMSNRLMSNRSNRLKPNRFMSNRLKSNRLNMSHRYLNNEAFKKNHYWNYKK